MPAKVSVIIPCYNEEATIQPLLEALYEQTYPRKALEVVIADGNSQDNTLQRISAWQTQHPELMVQVVPNPARIIPAALNVAIRAASGEIIVRMDAHAKPQPNYVELSVKALEAGLGQNVGGVWDIQPGADTWIAHSIAFAAGHPIGVGDARYRFTDQAGVVDTVPFGAFYHRLLDKIGMFDETLLTNEDYEFNTRVRQADGKIWLDPRIRSTYYARKNLRKLARQYWRYGYWKRQMLKRYPDTVRWRQALPPLFVLTMILLTILAPFLPIALWALMGLSSLYLIILVLAGLQLAVEKKKPALVLGVPLAIATMHFAWGAGFLWGIVYPPKSE